jgi:hypothetical protein
MARFLGVASAIVAAYRDTVALDRFGRERINQACLSGPPPLTLHG